MGASLLPGNGDNYVICTSSARPVGRDGLLIHETDTDRFYVHNGTTWVYQLGGTNPNLFQAYRTGALNAAASTQATVPFDNVSVAGIGYNTTTGVFTAPVAGLYDNRVSISVITSSNPWRGIVDLYYNGGLWSRLADVTTKVASGDPLTLHGSSNIYCNVSDTIEVKFHNVNGTTTAFAPGFALMWWQVVRVP